MIIISRRGAAGLAPENSLAAIDAGFKANADIIHLDVRVTKDKVPVLLHDASLKRTHGIDKSIHSLTLSELSKLTSAQPVPTLDQVLRKYLGRVLLSIEMRGRGNAKHIVSCIAQHTGKSAKQWNNLLISSFMAGELITTRKLAPKANLSLLHDNNPFAYIAYHRNLDLAAVGFHRLHTNRLAHQIAKKAGIFTYTYTINRPQAAVRMAKTGYDGIVTSYPDRINNQIIAD